MQKKKEIDKIGFDVYNLNPYREQKAFSGLKKYGGQTIFLGAKIILKVINNLLVRNFKKL